MEMCISSEEEEEEGVLVDVESGHRLHELHNTVVDRSPSTLSDVAVADDCYVTCSLPVYVPCSGTHNQSCMRHVINWLRFNVILYVAFSSSVVWLLCVLDFFEQFSTS